MNTTVSLPINKCSNTNPVASNQDTFINYENIINNTDSQEVIFNKIESESVDPIDPTELELRIKKHTEFIDSRCAEPSLTMTSCCYFKNNQNFVRVCEWNTMDDYIKSNNNMTIPPRTNIVCWWDFEPFDHRPVVMPLKYYDSIVWKGNLIKNLWLYGGNFCSFRCLKKYIDSGEPIVFNESYIDTHHIKMLTNMMFTKCYKTNGVRFDDIEPAPPRYALKKMGGVLNIDQFRGALDHYEMTSDPMIAVIPKLVQKIDNVAVLSAIKQNAVFPKKNGSYDDEYTLKRTKKRPCEKNTLRSFFVK